MKSANSGKKQDGRFKPGQSGNPAGKPKGARNKATMLIEELLDGEANAIGRKAVEMAKNGDTTAIRCHSACNIDPLSRGIGVQN